MAANSNDPDADPSDSRTAAFRRKGAPPDEPSAPMPPSKPLQVFLLIALLITGTAYVVGEWTDWNIEAATAKRPNKLHRLVEAQTKYLTEIDRGREAEAKGDVEGAVMHFRRALISQDTAEGHLHLGNAFLKAGRTDMAFSQFKAAIHLDPNATNIYLAWGHALTVQGKIDEVVQLYKDALRQNPNLAPVHYAYATVLEQEEQTALAARHQAESTEQPQLAARSAAEAQLYGSDALKQYEEAAKLGLNSPEFWGGYGALLNKEGKFKAAEECLSKATTLNPNLGPSQFQLAVAQERQGEYADAIGHYEAALSAMPDDAATLNNLALLYATAANTEVRSSKMAVLLATRACDATTDQNARYLDTLARAYAADGDFFQAISTEDKAVRRATQLDDHELLREFQPRFNLFVQHKTE